VLLVCVTAAVVPAQDAAAARMQLLRGDVAVRALARALDHSDVVVARTAARLLPAKGAEARMALSKALRHDDMMVRRAAAMNLDKLGADGLELVERALRDDSELVRQGAVFALMDMTPSEEATALLDEATSDDSSVVQRAAIAATRTAYEIVQEIPLPKEGWRFKTDAEEIGLDEQWYGADLDDSGWETIAIEQFWGDVGPDPGVGWYRRTIELPEREQPARVQLDFEAVDESTWVWVNGEFAGEHDLGPDGWNKPFRIDVTGLLNWGGENQVTIRVLNTAFAGGIYKPVSILVMKPAG
jgi:hypothetical protein